MEVPLRTLLQTLRVSTTYPELQLCFAQYTRALRHDVNTQRRFSFDNNKPVRNMVSVPITTIIFT